MPGYQFGVVALGNRLTIDPKSPANRRDGLETDLEFNLLHYALADMAKI